MKPHPTRFPAHSCGALRRSRLAFTLPEMMVSVGIFTLMTLGVVLTMVFGLKYDELVNSKLGASELSRMSFAQLLADIRGSKNFYVGNGSFGVFTANSNMNDQVGNAIQLCPIANDTSNYVQYWFDTNNLWLCRASNGASKFTIIAQYLTNASGTGMTFQAQDYAGNLKEDISKQYVIVATLEFCQYQYPITKVGPGNYYNFYQIQLVAGSHAPN